MEYGELIGAAEREIAALVDAVGGGSVTGSVPTCPGWSVRDLAVHAGEFCGFWSHVVCEGAGRSKTPYSEPPGDDGIATWLGDCGGQLVAVLRGTPPTTEVWTWYEPDRSAGFVARRAAHELAVHRFDAQSARGACTPIEAALAVDGIDEIVGPLLTIRPRSGLATGQTLHVHSTDEDVPLEILVTMDAGGVGVQSGHLKGDLALRGSPSDLELLLYGRPTLGTVDRFGDESVLDVWHREFTF